MIKTTGLSHLHLKFRIGSKMLFLSTPGCKDLLTLHQEENKKYQPGKNGGKLLERGKHGRHVPYAYLADPDGYVIELG